MRRSRVDCQQYFKAAHCLTLEALLELAGSLSCSSETDPTACLPGAGRDLRAMRVVLIDPLQREMSPANSVLVDTGTAHSLVMSLKRGQWHEYAEILGRARGAH
jgi:hypothetical protein